VAVEPGGRTDWVEVLRNLLRRMFGGEPALRTERLPWTGLDPVAYGSREAYWSRLTDRDPHEIQFLLELSERTPLGVTGVGYAVVPSGSNEPGWRPLILLDADHVEVPPVADLSRSIDRERLPADLGPYASDLPDAFFVPVGRAEPLSDPFPGDLVGPERSHSGPSSIGIWGIRRLESGEWQPGFFTTGHGFPEGIGAPVARVPKGRLRRMLTATGWKPRIGQVAIHRMPILPGAESDPKDYDYAFVDLDSVDADQWSPDDFEFPARGVFPSFDTSCAATVVCGVSGQVANATVLGAFMGYERWRDCWLLNPATAFAPGDSGSIVFLNATGEKLGLVVGRIAWDEVPHQFFVQSLERVLAVSQETHDVRVAWR
jgi:hypothetical protein